MQETVIEIMDKFGYTGVFLLIMIENIFPPIPSEIILTFGGFMTTYTQMNVWGVIAAATIGAIIGAIILYAVGMILNAERLDRLFDSKLGRVLHLKKGDGKKAKQWFTKWGVKAVFFCRFVPIVRSLISVPAGAARMKFGIFLSLTAAGTFIWNVVLVFLGRFAGDAWEKTAHYFDIYSQIGLVVIGLTGVIIGVIFIKKRFLNHTNDTNDTNDGSNGNDGTNEPD